MLSKIFDIFVSLELVVCDRDALLPYAMWILPMRCYCYITCDKSRNDAC